jgi:amino acid transporter
MAGGQGGTASLDATPFTWASFTTGSVAIALLFNFASFIGFEATTIYSDHGLQDYLANLQPDPTAFLFALGATYIGDALTTVMSLLFISSVFAALLAFNAVARYLYALGREGLVPAQLGHTHRTHLSPHTGSLGQSILALIVVLIFVITGQDPVLALFTWLTQLGTLAIIVLMALASFAVVAFFARHRDLDSNVLRTAVAPIVGGVAMTAVAIYAASQFGLLIGNPEAHCAGSCPP